MTTTPCELAISQIAWPNELEPAVAELLVAEEIRALEIAPTKVHPEPLTLSSDELHRYRDAWAGRGIRIVAMQSLLFGQPDLRLFGDEASRRALFDYLCGIIRFAGHLQAEVLVFGSPRNRQLLGRSREAAWDVAVDFFRRVGHVANDHGCWFCIEPNPTEYGCDFVTTAAEGIRLVQDVNQVGFGLHLDAAGMTLSGDPIRETFRDASLWWRHFHVSEPHLAPVGSSAQLGAVSAHGELADGLRESGYAGRVSIEMKTLPAADCLAGIRTALEFCRRVYG